MCKITIISWYHNLRWYPSLTFGAKLISLNFDFYTISCWLPHHTLQALNFSVSSPYQSQFTESSAATQETGLQGRKHLNYNMSGLRNGCDDKSFSFNESLSLCLFPNASLSNWLSNHGDERARVNGTADLLLALPTQQTRSDTITHIQRVISRHNSQSDDAAQSFPVFQQSCPRWS